jgi:hypothetical protein
VCNFIAKSWRAYFSKAGAGKDGTRANLITVTAEVGFVFPDSAAESVEQFSEPGFVDALVLSTILSNPGLLAGNKGNWRLAVTTAQRLQCPA